MKNRAIALAALALLFAALLTPSFASASNAGDGFGVEQRDLARVPAGERLPRFVDDMGLLTPEQAEDLTAKLDEISERHRFDAVVAVVPALDYRSARLYAADFFEQNGFGAGDNSGGAILLLATRDKDFGFASLGFGLRAFTPAGQEYLDKLFLPQLKESRYHEAFTAYAEAVDDFLTKAEAGAPYDRGNIPLTASERAKYRQYAVVISLSLALIIAFCVVWRWKRQLVSVRRDALAHAYIREGSMVLTVRNDIFLYRRVHRTRRVESDRGGGSSGGSSFSTSSGSSATGHSGKY